jgi:hypothetical protein
MVAAEAPQSPLQARSSSHASQETLQFKAPAVQLRVRSRYLVVAAQGAVRDGQGSGGGWGSERGAGA